MKYLLLVLAVIAFGVLVRPFMNPGYPTTHDGENHLARISNYTLALKQGQIPPRWAPSFWGGYGYPVFNYNYPLANIAAVPMLVVHIPTEEVLKIIQVLAIAVGAFGVFAFLRKEYGSEAALVGVGAYLTAPFLFNNLYVRGAVGEVLAYTVFPHVLNAVRRLVGHKTKFSVTYLFLSVFALMLAHNIFVLLLVPVVALYIFALIQKENMTVRRTVIGTSVLGIAASMFFWVPALLEKSLVSIDESSLISESIQHFPTLVQLLVSPYGFGYSYTSPVDGLSFSIGAVFLLSAVALCVGIATKRFRPTRTQAAVLILFGVCVFLMLPVSAFIWRLIFPLQYLQFPWRLLFLTSVFGTYLAAFFYSRLQGKYKWLLVLMLLVSVVSTASKQVSGYFHHDDAYYQSFSQTSTVLDENKPKTLTKGAGDLAPQSPLFEKNGTAEITVWNGSRHEYVVQSDVEQRVTEPTAYFPGWEVRVDGKEVPIEFDKAEGLISYVLPVGRYQVVTKITQHTPARQIGNGLTVLSLAIFSAYILRLRRTR